MNALRIINIGTYKELNIVNEPQTASILPVIRGFLEEEVIDLHAGAAYLILHVWRKPGYQRSLLLYDKRNRVPVRTLLTCCLVEAYNRLGKSL